MEKFSAWRDKATGISPFMPQPFPISQKKSNKTSLYLQLFLVKIPIFLIKFPICLILISLYYITGSTTILNIIFKLLFGFNEITYSVDGIKKSQISKLESYKPIIGDLIISNYISPLDGFIFSLISGTSKISILIPNKDGNLFEYSPWSLVNHCFGNKESKQPIQELSKFNKKKIVFLLLEGTTSNNQSILPFIKLNSKYSFENEFNIKSIVLKLTPNYFNLPTTIETSKFTYLFELLTDFKIKYFKIKIYSFNQLNLNEIRKSFELNSLALINNPELSIDGKEKFINYYLNHDIKK
ncbi:uncharacterized protein KGF55_004646 [Candida pseudojiufengensis]|uniref:uncharacterized protein n=1 Tax=Candida pseudojiufengensis TaxID=497109 RepID=UPI0022259182|nr:uncharacterized protein KGF55_004646 [Candida pseudojiufengensis]KAI5960354.1 hypothetical protein KGF55_004646 [Candida pseudojiufengensis]